VSTFVDRAMDRSVVLGYSKIGLAVRRRLGDWPADPPDGALAGRHVAVTGASSGLGIATAEGLAALGANVHLVVRDTDKGSRVRDDLLREVPSAAFQVWRCDVSDLDDVRRFSASFAEAVPTLAGLVHNAGAMPPERTESRQGHEMTMALHVLGPMLMTELLLAPLAADRGRVVMVTSGGMYTQPLPSTDPEYLTGEYKPPTAYARSKRTQVSLLPLLASRWGREGVDVHATHPGWADTPGIVESLPTFRKVTGPVLRSAAEGADTTVWLTAVEPAPPSGQLWHDRRTRPSHVLKKTQETAAERDAMWRWAQEAAGLPEH
jgi:dehydrogenase/reductase SDR family member 12